MLHGSPSSHYAAWLTTITLCSVAHHHHTMLHGSPPSHYAPDLSGKLQSWLTVMANPRRCFLGKEDLKLSFQDFSSVTVIAK
jgi:hypothetical protein